MLKVSHNQNTIKKNILQKVLKVPKFTTAQ